MKQTLLTLCLILFALLSWGEIMDDLVERDGLFYKKFIQTPFTGEITGPLSRFNKEWSEKWLLGFILEK